MFPIRVKTVQESDLRMLGNLARNIQRVLPVTQADIDAAAALGKGWVVWKVFEVSDPLDNLRGGTQLIIRQNSILPGQNVRRVIFVSGPGGQTVVIRGSDYIVLPDAIANSLSYVKAFGGTEQRNIPQPYTQVNYVTNTAQTAVNTGIMIDFAKNYEFEVEARATTGSWYILQSRETSASNITGISGSMSGNTITLVVGNVTACQSAITRTIGNKLYVKATLNNGIATLYVKDETAGTEDTQTGSYGASQPNPPTPVYLLGNAGGQYVDVNSDIYMARIKENDTVVMDYVPARQVATAGFYDKASGTFKTALTPANLSADGNTVPTPDAPMDIVSNNGVLKARHQSGLPLGYTLLDYIETTGTQYIDTGYKPNNNTTIKTKTYIITNSATPFGCRWSGAPEYDTFAAIVGGTGQLTVYYGRYSDGNYTPYLTYNKSIVHDIEINMNSIVYDGESIPIARGSFASTENMYLGAFNNIGEAQTLITGRIYSMEIKESNIMVCNLVPAKNSSNVIGMYDTVSGQFFTNQGTGDFTAGTAISDPVEIYTDGTVETIKDSLNNTATAEMLLKVGNYTDVQEILSGAVTRNVGVKVLDGTEPWAPTLYPQTNAYRISWTGATATLGTIRYSGLFCTHFEDGGSASTQAPNKMFFANDLNINFPMTSDFDTIGKCLQYLADQYAAGTPVIVIYPLETPTTESVAGQTLQVTDGDNVLEITQASLSNLELEAEYQAAVSLTIQEVQDANLDPNVQVIIS